MSSFSFFDFAATGSRQQSAAGRAGAGGSSSGGFFSEVGIGGFMQIGGALLGAITGFYGAKSQQHQLRSQALSLEHQQSISRINAGIAERDAQDIEVAGREEAGLLALRYAAEQGAQRARTGARGVAIGSGSAAEVAASIAFAAEVDAATINRNTVRAAGQRREQATDIRNQGDLAGVSAANVRATASSIRPGVAATGSLLSGFGQVASNLSNRFQSVNRDERRSRR